MGFSLKSLGKGVKSVFKTIGGGVGADAAIQGINAQADATNKANQLLYDTNQQIRADFAPRRAFEQNALAKLAAFNPAEIASDPGYQFQMGQGSQAVERSAAARGLLGSGATLKSLDRFGQGLASQYSGQRFNQLLSMATGIDGTTPTAAANQNYAQTVGNNITDFGNARASGYIAAANSKQNAAGNILGGLGRLAGGLF